MSENSQACGEDLELTTIPNELQSFSHFFIGPACSAFSDALPRVTCVMFVSLE